MSIPNDSSIAWWHHALSKYGLSKFGLLLPWSDTTSQAKQKSVGHIITAHIVWPTPYFSHSMSPFPAFHQGALRRLWCHSEWPQSPPRSSNFGPWRRGAPLPRGFVIGRRSKKMIRIPPCLPHTSMKRFWNNPFAHQVRANLTSVKGGSVSLSQASPSSPEA